MRTAARPIFAVTLACAALMTGGCGSGEDPTPAATRTPVATGMPVAQYVAEAGSLRQSVDDTRSDYYHGRRTTSALRRNTAAVQRSFAEAAQRLRALAPPSVAADLHARILDTWRRRAEQLEDVLAAERFDRGRVDDVMAQISRDPITDELYTLPQ